MLRDARAAADSRQGGVRTDAGRPVVLAREALGIGVLQYRAPQFRRQPAVGLLAVSG